MSKMIGITGLFTLAGPIRWQLGESESLESEDGVTLNFPLASYYLNRRNALKTVAAVLQRNDIDWLKPMASPIEDWVLDLEGLKAQFESFEFLQSVEWFRGRVRLAPEYEVEEREVFGKIRKETKVRFIVTPNELRSGRPLIDFPELAPFTERFRVDHPDPQHCAFLMMKYNDTSLHKRIVKAVKETCSRHGIEALRADDKRYADDLLPNVRTYMHGCDFGIAVSERLTEQDFSPNVSLEVGYMMAQDKPICLLKDSTLSSLHRSSRSSI